MSTNQISWYTSGSRMESTPHQSRWKENPNKWKELQIRKLVISKDASFKRLSPLPVWFVDGRRFPSNNPSIIEQSLCHYSHLIVSISTKIKLRSFLSAPAAEEDSIKKDFLFLYNVQVFFEDPTEISFRPTENVIISKPFLLPGTLISYELFMLIEERDSSPRR